MSTASCEVCNAFHMMVPFSWARRCCQAECAERDRIDVTVLDSTVTEYEPEIRLFSLLDLH